MLSAAEGLEYRKTLAGIEPGSVKKADAQLRGRQTGEVQRIRVVGSPRLACEVGAAFFTRCCSWSGGRNPTAIMHLRSAQNTESDGLRIVRIRIRKGM